MRPILNRRGGKKLLVKKLLKECPPHKIYVEPFMGAGNLFFAKPPAKTNILGDNDKDLMTFYKQIQNKTHLTCDMKRNADKWHRLKAKKTKTPCEYAYVTKWSYAGDGEYLSKGRIKPDEGGPRSFDDQVKLLKNAKLVSSDFRNIVKKNDTKKTFHYLDPPYYQASCHYPKGSCDVTPKDIYTVVKGIKGKFLLSYNNNPEIRKIFCQKFKCAVVNTKYSVMTRSGSTQATHKELIIKNY